MTLPAAITFDLWNTLLVERGEGLIRPRAQLWRTALAEAIETHDFDLTVLEEAHAAALTRYKDAWARNEQFGPAEAVDVACAHLGLVINDHTRAVLVASFHQAGLRSDLGLVPGARELLLSVHQARVKTAIICDIGLTPSTALIERLDAFGVLELIDVFAWSDVFGRYKPDPRIFEWTLAKLDVDPAEAVHVGDRLRTDVGGARGAGMGSIRFRGVFDDLEPLPEADHVVDTLWEIEDLLS